MPTKPKIVPLRTAALVRFAKCPLPFCTYERPYTDASWYLDRFIDHPFYGAIKGRDLVKADLNYHHHTNGERHVGTAHRRIIGFG
jgi:hypothetical protein